MGAKNEYRAAEAAYRVTFAMENAVFVLESFAYTEVEKQEANSGADASNPTAAVNYQDLRYRYFDLDIGRTMPYLRVLRRNSGECLRHHLVPTLTVFSASVVTDPITRELA